MSRTNFDALLDAGVHFGHLRRKWNPAMAPFIFMERNGIHIIDLYKTMAKIDEAAAALKQIAKSGKKVLFVATKKQAKEIVAEHVRRVNMPYVTERWPGGMLTNFATIRKAVRKMLSIDKLMVDLNYFGLLFESLAIRDLRIYAEANDGKVYHYRDSRGLEIDAIIEYADGTWGAFEIKLGIGAADYAAENLLKFAEKIDTKKTKAPASLTVITGNGFAHRRPDGVNVVPLSALTI